MRRRVPGIGSRFRGDLKQLSLVQVLQYCERRGLTGCVTIDTPQGTLEVDFDAGQMILDESPEAEELLAQLMEVDCGTFAIESQPLSFREIEAARFGPQPTAAPASAAGRLSGVCVGERMVQLQTEYEPGPEPRLVTVVLLGGRVVKKHVAPVSSTANESQVRAAIDEQHRTVERIVNERVDTLLGRQSSTSPTAADDKNRLFEQGLQKWRQKDFSGALELLEKARALSPHDRLLRANIEIVRRKLGASA